MSAKFVKVAAFALCGALTLSSGSVFAQEPKSLDDLLNYVKQGQVAEAKENRDREARFSKDKANQAQALRNAEAERTRQEQLSAQLENTFEEKQQCHEGACKFLEACRYKRGKNAGIFTHVLQ